MELPLAKGQFREKLRNWKTRRFDVGLLLAFNTNSFFSQRELWPELREII